MASTKKFWIFSDVYSFFGFFTQILYNLIPIAFLFQLRHGVLNKERLSYVGILCLYSNAFLYFWVSIYRRNEVDDIDPLDFCNLVGAYLGYVYLIVYFYFLYFKVNKLHGIILICILTFVSGGIFLLIKYTVNSDKDNNWVKIFNWFGVVFNLFENLPLGFDIIYLIKNKISEKYTLFGAFFGFINECTWLSWAIIGQFINGNNLVHCIVANILGICLQSTLFFIFFRFRKNEEEEGSNNNINYSNFESSLNDLEGENNKNANIIDHDSDAREESKEPDYIQDLL